uniref:Protein kinase domain-containing protein n=1 Tax=Macrostomum lignano TaxID=282301 RepID=A0A1I8FD76_9PLAT
MSRANAAAAAAAATAAAQSSPRRGAYNLVVLLAGNYTWCPDLDYLADGVTSSVYRCRDIHTGDFYAVKVFKGTPPRREVELLKKLKHENIVRLITGVQFQRRVGLSSRKQLKIVHRDIKPATTTAVSPYSSWPTSAPAANSKMFGTYEFLHPSIYLEVHQRMHAGMGGGARGGHKPECDLWSLGWTFPKFFETVNWYKCQHCTYYFVAGNMIMPDLVFSQKQSLDSLSDKPGLSHQLPKEEIVVFYRSQERCRHFQPDLRWTSPVIVLSKQQFSCTLDIGKLRCWPREIPSRVPDPNQPKEIKDFVDEAHRHALVCRQLASVCHVNHALTLEAKDAALCLMDRRGREAYQRELSEKISQWQRKLETVVSQQSNLKPDAASNSGSALAGMSNEQSSLVPSLQLASNFNGIFARLLAPKQGAECLSADFHRVEQVYERYGQMINKFMKKDSQLLTDLMRHCFKSDQHLLNSCLDDCQNVVLRCCIETLGKKRQRAKPAAMMQDVQAEDLEADLDMLHDNVYRGIFEALTAYFKATKASKESDLNRSEQVLDEATSATSSSNTDVRDRFKSLFTPNLQQLSSIFAKHGFELRLAGGAVRDLLMKMVSMFNAEGVRMINSNGLAHGTVTARIGDAENF